MSEITTVDLKAILDLLDRGVGLREISGRTLVPLSLVRALMAEHRPEVAARYAAKLKPKSTQAASINTNERGLCSVCGHDCSLMANGHPRPHRQRRVRLGAGGEVEVYTAAAECDGLLHPAEPLEVA